MRVMTELTSKQPYVVSHECSHSLRGELLHESAIDRMCGGWAISPLGKGQIEVCRSDFGAQH